MGGMCRRGQERAGEGTGAQENRRETRECSRVTQRHETMNTRKDRFQLSLEDTWLWYVIEVHKKNAFTTAKTRTSYLQGFKAGIQSILLQKLQDKSYDTTILTQDMGSMGVRREPRPEFLTTEHGMSISHQYQLEAGPSLVSRRTLSFVLQWYWDSWG